MSIGAFIYKYYSKTHIIYIYIYIYNKYDYNDSQNMWIHFAHVCTFL